MKTKLFTLFVALACASSAFAYDCVIDGIYYDLNYNLNYTDLTAAVVNETGSSDAHSYSGTVVIPSTITYNSQTYSVTAIGFGAFWGCSDLVSVTIGDSVTTIEDFAIYLCPNLSSVTLGKSVKEINDCNFEFCTGITSINVNADNSHFSSIDGVLFNYAKDTLIQYPIGNTRTEYAILNSVTTIGEMAFAWCEGLTSVTIPNSVTTIGNSAFYNCSGLTSVTIPNSVTTIGGCAFDDCSGLTSVTIGNSVTTIGESAFWECSSLTSVTIGNSVTTIGRCAFSYCSKLISVTIPNSVKAIGEFAFSSCTGLQSVTFLGNACQEAIEECAFYSVGAITPATLTLPDSWTGIKPNEDGRWYGGWFKEDDTALPQMRAAKVKATKVLTNSQLLIRTENKTFSILGQEVK